MRGLGTKEKVLVLAVPDEPGGALILFKEAPCGEFNLGRWGGDGD